MGRLGILFYVLSSVFLVGGKQTDFLGSNKTQVDIKEYDFYAIVTPVGRPEAYCGATLVSPLFLISAHHCLKFTSLKQKWQAHFGVQNVREPPTGLTVNVQRVYFHGKAVVDEGKIKNDIALLKLQTEVKTIKPVNISQQAPTPGEVGVVIGYEGRSPRWQHKERFRDVSSEPGRQRRPLLKKLQMIQMKSACVDDSADAGGLFCSYNPPESFADCRMDSGGPWFHETRPGYKILVGVSTFGDFYCNAKGINGLYTDVHAYRDWIVKVLKDETDGDIRVVSYDDGDKEEDEDDDDNENEDHEEDDGDGDEEEDDNDDEYDNNEDDEEDDDDDEEDDDNDDEYDNNEDDEDDDNDEEDDDDDYNDDEEDDDNDDDYEDNNEDDYYDNENDDGSDEEDDNENDDGSDEGDDNEDDDDDEEYDSDDDYDEEEEGDFDNEDVYGHNYNDDDEYVVNEWLPSGSPFVIGPPFTR